MKKYIIIAPIFIVFSLLVTPPLHSQEQIDAGIFESAASDTFFIKARPTYAIENLSLTNAQLTLKWEENSGVTALDWLGTSIGLFPQGFPVIANGYYYQVYASFGGSSINWAAGEEYTILIVAPNNQDFNCSKFEIADDDWTAANNGDYYMEVIGEDRTGIRYEPYLNYGSEGGFVDGDTSIYVGESTGTLTLMDYHGTILTWQRKLDQGAWLDIAGTAGMTEYEESPAQPGTYLYRAEVQFGSCPPLFSLPATVIVEYLAVWTGAVDTAWENFGNWNVVGVPDYFTDAIIPVVGTNNYPVVSGKAIAKKLTIDAGASIIIGPLGELTLGSDLVNDGDMLIRADEGGTGSLLNEGAVSGNGTFRSQIAYDPLAWHEVSAAVRGESAGPFLNLNISRWEESTSNWVPVYEPDTLETFKGYRIDELGPGIQVTEFTGDAYHTGIYVTNLTNSGTPDGHNSGFNLVGNPYPSAVNWNTSGGWVRNQVDPALYIYNSDAHNYGTYLPNDPASSTLGVDSIIGSGQGFFVHVGHEFNEGDLVVNNSARQHDHRNIQKTVTQRSPEPLARLKVYMAPETLRDEVVVRFREGATAEFDRDMDVYDLPGWEFAPMLFTRGQDTLRMAVNSYPPLAVNTDIPMGFSPGQDGSFILKVAEMSNFGLDTLLFLEDLKWNTVQKLTEGQELEILSFNTDDIDRFVLKFQVEPIGLHEINETVNFSAYFSGQCLNIRSQDQEPLGRITVMSMTGQVIMDKEFVVNQAVMPLDLPAGIYLVRRMHSDKSDVMKLMKGS